ncbi:FGGY family carbohydrate kinase [Phytoactinopolyspora limicola]|uniref:FGGY family carbohydrate kinase n=1 Tax=Phytoactinopolyspora limicola TaxID=2715536 RepID=UPI001A9CB554|nr:FGGY family carbohydrate kinase [Phytoactinopolyspora limicola]
MIPRPVAYLGLDVGTSGLKLVLLGLDGHTLVAAEEPYTVLTPAPGHAETDPHTWTAAAASAATRIGADLAHVDVAAIGIAGQMHGVVLCDDTGTAVAPAILWPDRRAAAEAQRWHELPSTDRDRLANPIVPGMTGPILAWLAEHHPDVVNRAAVALPVKDAVRASLLDEPVAARAVTERSDASATLLWDLFDDTWASGVCAAVGVPARLLPAVAPSAEVVGRTGWLGRLVAGASTDVPVVTGAGDTAAALLALGARQPADILINFGTGAQVLSVRASPAAGRRDRSVHLYADAGDSWYAMAALQNGGLALEWAAEVLGLTWAELVSTAAEASAGAGGVSFLPFLTGERGAVASPTSHGGWLGAGTTTTRADLARAAIEGVLFSIRHAFDLLGIDGTDDAATVTLSGGGWRAPLLSAMAADILSRPVRRIDVRSASATGAAILAASGVGEHPQPRRSTDAELEPAPTPALLAAAELWDRRRAAAEM